MKFELPTLPFDKKSLAPYISEETLDFHYGKHHKTYVDKLNTLVEGTEFANKSLEEIIKTADGAIFNNAAQIWNHTFYWNCLTNPTNEEEISSKLIEAIKGSFGDLEKFKDEFSKAAASLFGSGWTWLVKNKDQLEIVPSSNAGNPIKDNKTPLLTCDVWEHAYYIDYRNARPKYLESFWKIVNWKFVSGNF